MSVRIGIHFKPGRTYEFRCKTTGIYQACMAQPSRDMELLQRALTITPKARRTVWQRLGML